MNIDDWLKLAEKQLRDSGIGTARLDALVLLEDATYKDRSWLLAHSNSPINDLIAPGATRCKSLDELNQWIKRRQKHEPLAYIRSKTEFYGREFLIDKRVLEPRPESETMIELLKEACSVQRVANSGLFVADIGTGSGALAITVKLEIPEAAVIATDIDPGCLAVARKNAKKHLADVEFHQGNLLEPLTANPYPLTAILCNLPYVPDNYQINQAAGNEPRIAIFGGPDGLDLYRKLFRQISNNSQKPSFVLTESLPFQHKGLALIAKACGYKLIKTDDFIQLFSI